MPTGIGDLTGHAAHAVLLVLGHSGATVLPVRGSCQADPLLRIDGDAVRVFGDDGAVGAQRLLGAVPELAGDVVVVRPSASSNDAKEWRRSYGREGVVQRR
jgi:hypothetical protein